VGHGIFLYGRCKQLFVIELNNAYFSRHLFENSVWDLHNSLLYLLLKNCDYLNTDIPQGSVATRLGCGGVFKYDCYKFPTESNSEIIFKYDTRYEMLY